MKEVIGDVSKEFYYPRINPEALVTSLQTATRGTKAEIPEELVRPASLRVIEDFAPVAGWVSDVDVFSSMDDIRRAVQGAAYAVKPDSHPGYPWCNIAHSKGTLLFESGYGPEVVECAADRVWQLLHGVCPENAREALEQGFVGMARPFIKVEPHPVRKRAVYEDGLLVRPQRDRPIIGRCVVDELAERVLFGGFNKALLGAFPMTPAAYGIGFTDEVVDSFMGRVSSVGTGETFVCDMSGWDRTVSHQLLSEGMGIVCALGSSDLGNAGSNWATAMAYTTYALPTGQLVAKTEPGNMASGSYLTSSVNSVMRILVAYAAGDSAAWANGDDTIEKSDDMERTLELYRSFGFTVRELQTQSTEQFSFCSHLFTRDGAELESWRRCLYRLAATLTEEGYVGVMEEIRNNSDEVKERFRALLPFLKRY